jgi:hypothetical protein
VSKIAFILFWSRLNVELRKGASMPLKNKTLRVLVSIVVGIAVVCFCLITGTAIVLVILATVTHDPSYRKWAAIFATPALVSILISMGSAVLLRVIWSVRAMRRKPKRLQR